jgi:hypothetical protein
MILSGLVNLAMGMRGFWLVATLSDVTGGVINLVAATLIFTNLRVKPLALAMGM